MSIIYEDSLVPSDPIRSHAKMSLLQQMAEALEDEASGLCRRAIIFEEEEALLSHEVESHQTEVNRLLLRLEALRTERKGLLERIEALKLEAAAMREEVFDSEEDQALAAIENTRLISVKLASTSWGAPPATPVKDEQMRNSVFFHRMTLPGASK